MPSPDGESTGLIGRRSGDSRGGRLACASSRATPETVRAAANEDTRVRLRLQRRAPGNRRRHVARAVRRFVVLVVADLAAYWVMRALLRAVRDYSAVGRGGGADACARRRRAACSTAPSTPSRWC